METGLSVPLLETPEDRFSRDEAHIFSYSFKEIHELHTSDNDSFSIKSGSTAAIYGYPHGPLRNQTQN